MSVIEDSPSAERRKALKEADAANQLRVLGSCPLSKYIDIADRLLDHFQDSVDGRRLDEAYVFGLRFANLCISSLPQHPEWRHDTTNKGPKRVTSQVGDVLCMMDVIRQRMDAEELIRIKAEMIAKDEEEARKKEEEDRRKHQVDGARQREQKIRDALAEERAQFLAEQRSQRQEEIKQKETIVRKKERITKKKDVEKSAMAKLQAMQAQMSSMEEHKELGEDTVTASKKNTKQPKIIKTKVKEDGAPKTWFGRGEKKSNLKRKEEKATLRLPCLTQPSKMKDDTTTTLFEASIGEKKAIMSKNAPESIVQQDNQNKSLERKPSPRSNEKKTKIVTSAENQENEIESENNEVKTTIAASVDNREIEISPSFHTTLTRSSKKSKKKDADSANSIKSKKSTPISFIKSNIVSAKPSISIIPLPMLSPSTKASGNGSANSVTATIIAAQQTPRSRNEKATIDKLKRAISVQEDRLEEIEGRQIPSLLHAAKTFLREDNKQEALKCLAHKKRLERQVDTTKAAVFNMETQMFMLESAFEDRYVKKALDEAAAAIAGFQKNIGDPKAAIVDLTDMSASLPELDIGDSTDEELMEELEEWLSPEDKKKSQENKDSYANDDDISLLSMPAFLPVVPVATPIFSSPDRNLNAIIGE